MDLFRCTSQRVVWTLKNRCRVTMTSHIIQDNNKENRGSVMWKVSPCRVMQYIWFGSLQLVHHGRRILRHYSDVIMIAMASQIPALRLFTQPFIQAHIKANINAPSHWPLWGEFTGDRWFPAQKASNAENLSIWWRHYATVKNPRLSHMTSLTTR